MYRDLYFVIFSLHVFFLPIAAAENVWSQKVWIDTSVSLSPEAGEIDEALALIDAFHSAELNVLGVSTVFGNANIDEVQAAAENLSASFGPKDLKVFQGAKSARFAETEASDALADALSKQMFTIVALGPLTNIGVVLRNHPRSAANIARVVIVAGRKHGQRFLTGWANRAHPDFNFEQDPASMQWLLDSKAEIVLIPFELSSKLWITESDLFAFRNAGKATRYLVGPSENWLNFWKTNFGVNAFNPFDAVAVEYVVRPDLFECESRKAEIKTLPDDAFEKEGEAMKPYLISNPLIGRKGRPVTYCSMMNETLKEDMMRRLLRNSN
jgi:pyrimidine-specific ribonucleoside hydrolase